MNLYEVAFGSKVEALIEEVERLTGLGYVCQGGIAISESYGRMAQAMVLKTIDPIGPEPATVTLYPTSIAPAAGGGSGSINLTITSPGTWEVDAGTVPAWIAFTPMGPQTEDVNILYTAEANPGAARSATIAINDAALAVDQDAGAAGRKK